MPAAPGSSGRSTASGTHSPGRRPSSRSFGTRAAASSCWLEWGEREIPLSEGEHILGRDPGALVRITTPRVSRRHARILVQGDRAILDDLGSKNGTFLGDDRIEGSTELTDRNEIWIGSEVLTFRAAPTTLVTVTATRTKRNKRTRSRPS